MKRYSTRKAALELSRRDPVIRKIVAAVGLPRFPARDSGGPFSALARMIVYQQLARNAARSIHERLVERCGGILTPEALLSRRMSTLRSCGLSESKSRSLKDLARRCASGETRLEALGRLHDEEVVEELTRVRGIGVWTAQMFLMFELRRPDVWPVLDLGVRQGYSLAYETAGVPKPKELEPLGAPFQPYRSVAAWYMWRAVELARRDRADKS